MQKSKTLISVILQFAPDDPDVIDVGFVATYFYANADISIATSPADNFLYISGMVFRPMD
jgi:hypothetical protein